jgi:cobalt-zinc-cadmium efflux system outer membrane protein
MLLVLALLIPQDTVRLPADAALDRALTSAPVVTAIAARVEEARRLADVRSRRSNPRLGVLAENLGVEREVTGRDGLAGVEGQVTLEFPTSIGGGLGAARSAGRAGVAVATAEAELAQVDLRHAILRRMAEHQRIHRILDAVADESQTLTEMARAMTAQAAEGRAAEGHAARVRMEAASTASALARREAEAAVVDADLAGWLGLAPETPIRITAAACGTDAGPTAAAAVRVASARVGLAEAETAVARAVRIPELAPQVGFRRSAGFSGLLLGLSLDLPLFNGGGARLAAAEATQAAAQAEQQQLERQLLAEAAGERRALALLDARATTFGAGWQDDLALAVGAAAARWDEGAGTLAELLEARRARLAALEEHATWSAARAAARLALARAAGHPIAATLLTDDCSGAVR